jgi:hypothetical protein
MLAQLTLSKIDHHTEAVDELDVEGILAFAERILPRASDLWVQASLDYKQRLQQLFCPEGIAFDGNRFSRTAVTAPLFKYLASGEKAEENLASQRGEYRSGRARCRAKCPQPAAGRRPERSTLTRLRTRRRTSRVTARLVNRAEARWVKAAAWPSRGLRYPSTHEAIESGHPLTAYFFPWHNIPTTAQDAVVGRIQTIAILLSPHDCEILVRAEADCRKDKVTRGQHAKAWRRAAAKPGRGVFGHRFENRLNCGRRDQCVGDPDVRALTQPFHRCRQRGLDRAPRTST